MTNPFASMSSFHERTFSPWRAKGESRVVATERTWKEPLQWSEPQSKRWRVLVTADVFEDWQGPMVDSQGRVMRVREESDPEEWNDAQVKVGGGWMPAGPMTAQKITERVATMQDVRARLFELIDATPNLDWLLLTKRPESIAKMTPPCTICDGKMKHHQICKGGFRHNLWLGTSVENQAAADARIPHLLRAPAAVRFLSCEPLLGPVDLEPWMNMLAGSGESGWLPSGAISWVIVGGESGPGARPMHPDWARSLRDQCQAAGVPFFFKQWGEYVEWDGSQSPSPSCRSEDGRTPYVRLGKKAAGRLLDGREWNEFPAAKGTVPA